MAWTHAGLFFSHNQMFRSRHLLPLGLLIHDAKLCLCFGIARKMRWLQTSSLWSEQKEERRGADPAMSIPSIKKVKVCRCLLNLLSFRSHWPEVGHIFKTSLVAREVGKSRNRIVMIHYLVLGMWPQWINWKKGRMDVVEATNRWFCLKLILWTTSPCRIYFFSFLFFWYR